jgi:PPK2 family polyphosphate:nucleotide phosphotransferase
MAQPKSFRTLLRARRHASLAAQLARSTPGVDSEDSIREAHRRNLDRLGQLQYQLSADGRFGLLVILQAMDAGGKDGTIRHVISAFNPQGCAVSSFKVPTPEEARHDFLWRIHRRAPGRGEIAVFNRSHYEDVLVARVDALVPVATWRKRYVQINAFEATLWAHDIHVVKFMLHVSREEQLERLRKRLEQPHKRWKFDPSDLEKRKQWNAYRRAYEDALSRCNPATAPWYVIPADRKWYRDYAVARILRETLEDLPLEWPEPKLDPKKIRLR